MSHSGSPRRGRPPRRALKVSLAALSIGCAGLTGCGRRAAVSDTPVARTSPDAVTQTVLAGYEAFRDGDKVRLEGDLQKLAAQLPEDETQGVFVDCSPQRAHLRRLEQARRILAYLDNGTALAMGEAERFIYFQQLTDGDVSDLDASGRPKSIEDGAPRDPLFDANAPSDFECGLTKGYLRVEFINGRQADILQSAGRERLGRWLISLRAQFGPQLDARMQNAIGELNGYHLVSADQWRAPALQPNDVVADEPADQRAPRGSGVL